MVRKSKALCEVGTIVISLELHVGDVSLPVEDRASTGKPTRQRQQVVHRIENMRLFEEVQARTRELAKTVAKEIGPCWATRRSTSPST